ncbi:MAG: YbjN domain-containing protein [Brevundimonas sp.]|jgi:hypothetical protein|uniref:YbjN domain-containing protein n=1 Tax=Brevundimonas sp. TaxID=1871086 RepID=UPI00179C2EB0|nr:YbjN domain-containing protein [Brevundimonas sp.]MBA4803411.1 YbjN domain-containing protein [Brevundimonas sp.]
MRLTACFAALSLLVAAAPAAAQTSQPGLPISEVSTWIASKGGEVQPVQRQGEDTWITVRDGALTWLVFFYGCQNDVCSDVQYSASFTNEAITPEILNVWNRDHRFLKAFHIPAEGGGITAVVQYDLLLQPGGVEQLNDPTSVWVGLLEAFAREVGYLPPAAAQPSPQ